MASKDERKTKSLLIGELEQLRAQLKKEKAAGKKLKARLEDSKSRIKDLDDAGRSRQAFSQAFNQSSSAIAIVDAGGTILYANPKLFEAYGLTSGRVIGKSWDMVLSSNSGLYQHASDIDKTLQEKGETWTGEFSDTDSQGETIWREARIFPIKDARKKMVNVVYMSDDITERKRAEERLRESEERFRALSDCSPVGIYYSDMKSGRVFINERLREISGMSEKESREDQWVKQVHPDDLEALMKKLYKARADGTEMNHDIRIITPDGQAKWVHLRTAPVKSAQGEPLGRTGTVEDITERKTIEDALRGSEERFRRTFDFSPIGAVAVSLDFKFLRCNESFCSFLGYAESELLGKTFLDVTHPEDLEIGQEEIRAIRAKELDTASFPKRYLHKDGRTLWGHVNIRMLWDANGEPLHFMTVVQDITERKRAEDALRQSEETMRALLDGYPEVALLIDLDGTLYDCNKVLPERHDLLPEQMIGKNIFEQLSPEVAESRRAWHQKAIDTKQPVYFEDERDGRIFANYLSPVLNQNGEVARTAVYSREITDIKRAEEELQKEKDQARMYLDIAEVILLAINREGEIIRINRKGCEVLGYPEGEILGRNWFENFIPERDRPLVEKVFHRLMDGEIEPVEYFENVVVSKDGEERTIAWHNTFILDRQGNIQGSFSSGQDITEKRRMEEEIQRAQKLESIGVLAGGIAHDFNNILTGILGNLSLARMKLGPEDYVYDLLSESERACNRASDLTRQLLTFSKGGAPVKKTVSISELIRESAVFALRGSNVDCEFDFEEGLWPVEIDPGQINQVINNLVINSDQAMPNGGVVHISAENIAVGRGVLPTLPKGDYVKVTVIDNGHGIKKEYLPRIFDPFFTTKEKGSGLGLSTSYSIIKKHSGLIEVNSRLGEGASFTVYLPARKDAMIEVEGIPREDRADFKGRKVLVMEDEEVVGLFVKKMLELLGCEAHLAIDGEEAVARFKSAKEAGRPFDAAVLDLTIRGGMGGKETIKKLREIDPQIKAIVASGYSNDPIMANHEDYGFAGAVPKPFKIEDLKNALHKLFQNENQPD